MKSVLMVISLALALAGCQSYNVVQRNVFANDDGYIVTVDYGVSDSYHVNKFTSPVTGQEMDFKSKLVVKVHLPDDTSFKAWQCMNFLPRGTMYGTDNGKWKFLANGFSCIIYRRTDDVPPRYQEVYQGVICDSPDSGIRKDDRWYDPRKKDSKK